MTEKFYLKEDKDKENLGVYESRRLIGPDSYDDQWNLVNYTSELRDSKDNVYAFVDFHSNEGTIRECPHCLEYEVHNKLKPRILKKGEVKAPDYDVWTQCYECGNVYPIYQTYPESEIKDSLQTTSSPLENETIFLCTETTANKRRKRELRDGRRKDIRRYRSKKIDHDTREDLDIQKEIDIYSSDNVRTMQ